MPIMTDPRPPLTRQDAISSVLAFAYGFIACHGTSTLIEEETVGQVIEVLHHFGVADREIAAADAVGVVAEQLTGLAGAA